MVVWLIDCPAFIAPGCSIGPLPASPRPPRPAHPSSDPGPLVMIGILGDRVDRLQELVRAPVCDRGEVRALGPAPAVGQVPVDLLAEVFVAASCATEICPASATIFG